LNSGKKALNFGFKRIALYYYGLAPVYLGKMVNPDLEFLPTLTQGTPYSFSTLMNVPLWYILFFKKKELLLAEVLLLIVNTKRSTVLCNSIKKKKDFKLPFILLSRFHKVKCFTEGSLETKGIAKKLEITLSRALSWHFDLFTMII
jgi:hypothetical protein